MTKKRTLLIALLSLVVALIMGIALVGCSSEKPAEKFAISWQSSGKETNFTVSVEGMTELPTEIEQGKTVIFTVTPNAGYEVVRVQAGNKSLEAKDGKYEVKVEAVTKITVTTIAKLSEVVVSKNPTKLTYFAGETLNPEGMVVTLKYENNTTTTTANYTINYTGTNTAFAIGDKSFTVSYSGKTSAPVNLTGEVVGKVTIATLGLPVPEETLNAWKAFENYKNENGVVTFTFKTLANDIALPELQPGLTSTGQYVAAVKGWKIDGETATSISKDIKTSVRAELDVEVSNLLDIEEIHIRSNEGKAQLVISGKFNAANSAYLYLYEGNDKVELKGPQVDGERGKAFELVYDLANLSATSETETSYEGKWMDIKFCAAFGDVIHTQEIDITQYPEGFVDLNEEAIEGNWIFQYKTHTPDGTTHKNLKVVFNPKPDYQLTGVEVTGTKLADAKVVISGSYVASTDKAEAQAWLDKCFLDLMNWSWTTADIEPERVLNNDLTFTISYALANVEANQYFMHFVESNKNLETAKINPENVIMDDTYAIYLDLYTGWGSNLVRVNIVDKLSVSFACSVYDATLSKENDKAIITLNGTYEVLKGTMTEDEIKAALATKMLTPQQNDGHSQKTGAVAGWEYVEFETLVANITLDTETKTFAIKYDITEIAADVFTIKFDKKDVKPTPKDSVTITVGTKTYVMQVVAPTSDNDPENFWGCAGLIVTDTAAE